MFKKFVLLTLVFCAFGMFSIAVPAAAQTPHPLVIDSDMASDDWMATLYMLNDPDYSLKAITVTGTGFAYCDAGVRVALGLLALTNYGDVPVSCWRETPLVGDNAPPAAWRTNLAAANALGLPEGGKPADQDAVALFTSTISASPDKVTVLALGPLTNIAAAFDADPTLIDNIEMIYVMGGAVDVPGSGISDENTTAEWNIYCDPHAARLVFESGALITLVPLDATNDVPITMDFLNQLEAAKQTPEAEFVYTLLSNSIDSIQSGGYYFWDPLAAGILSDPSLVTLVPRDVTVIDTPGAADDGRIKPVGNGSRIQVATVPDGAAFEQRLIDTWNS